MEFEDAFDLLRAVQEYKPAKRESIAPLNSVKGTFVGFNTVDSEGPMQTWEISIPNLKSSCALHDSDGELGLYQRMRSFADLRDLYLDLRAGRFKVPLPKLGGSEPELIPVPKEKSIPEPDPFAGLFEDLA